ncbi:MAG: P-II family nitrogen regulator [Bacteroidales bacterium]|jgi:nitrogen regulatory protein P-II 2|nr:P-II family nitrogen regulator [Bacteroidales bacterium]
MKYVIALIQPHRLDEVKEALYKADVNLMTVSEVLGHGKQKGVTEVYRGNKETGNMMRKLKIEIAVNDKYLEPWVKAISTAAKTGSIGDGKIFVYDLEEGIRIRTGEKGSKAIG